MKRLTEVLERMSAIKVEIEELRQAEEAASEDTPLSDDHEERVASLVAEFDKLDTERKPLEERQKEYAKIAEFAQRGQVEHGSDRGVPAFHKNEDPFEGRDGYLSRTELRDRGLKVLESRGKNLASKQGDHVDSLLRTRNKNVDGAEIARRMLLTENDDYRSAFMKGVTAWQTPATFTEREAAAMQAFNEYRAASLTNADGGFGVPVLIDPTIILTSGAADAPILRIARVETITTNQWKGVSSAGVTWSYDGSDASGTEVSDDAATLAQPTVGTNTARGFIPYGIEIGMDYPGFAEEMQALLNQGYIDLIAENTITGSGTNVTGIFTALDANTNVEVVTATDGEFNPDDVLNVWKSLPERYRSRASWIMHTDVENEITKFGTATANSYGYTNNLSDSGVPGLRGRPIYLTDYAPEFTGTTGAANILTVGDFSNFVIAQRAGMSVELVPHLFGVTTGLPTGQRGWYAYARHGYDSVNDLGFRLLQNQ